jgi:uncharacterized protein
MRRVVQQLGLLQVDSVNVLVPAHYQVVYSRLGPYDRRVLDDLIYRKGEFTEQWAHEASIIPVETWPLLRHRMDSFRLRPWGFGDFMDAHPEYVDWVYEEVRIRGPLRGEDLDPPKGVERRIPGSWYSSVGRATLEAHLARGRIAVTGRGQNFAREFDLAERVIPPEHHGREISQSDAQRELIRKASISYGVACMADLADYYRMKRADALARVAELLEAGELEAVKVEGWREAAYLARGAKIPRSCSAAAALISPLDPLVWFRARAERLFGFHYRIEIYTPAAKRKFGYYVLPFLYQDKLVARVDLKADRKAGTLRVEAAHREQGADPQEFVAALAAELSNIGKWLGLESVTVGRRGKLAPMLRALSSNE